MAKFCDFRGQVGKCGVYIKDGSSNRCPRHQKSTERPLLAKIGRFSGASAMRKKEGFKTPGIAK